jgi:hypothetical protein
MTMVAAGESSSFDTFVGHQWFVKLKVQDTYDSESEPFMRVIVDRGKGKRQRVEIRLDSPYMMIGMEEGIGEDGGSSGSGGSSRHSSIVDSASDSSDSTTVAADGGGSSGSSSSSPGHTVARPTSVSVSFSNTLDYPVDLYFADVEGGGSKLYTLEDGAKV